jgi:hypothetical protein
MARLELLKITEAIKISKEIKSFKKEARVER